MSSKDVRALQNLAKAVSAIVVIVAGLRFLGAQLQNRRG